MKKTINRIFTLALATVMTATLFVGCSGSSESGAFDAGKKITVVT